MRRVWSLAAAAGCALTATSAATGATPVTVNATGTHPDVVIAADGVPVVVFNQGINVYTCRMPGGPASCTGTLLPGAPASTGNRDTPRSAWIRRGYGTLAGELYVLAERPSGSTADDQVLVWKSVDNGASWTTLQPINVPTFTTETTEPNISVVASSPYVVMGGSTGSTFVLWAAGWTTTTRLGGGGNVSVPAISYDAITGALWVAWYDASTRSVYVRESTGDRKRFGPFVRLPVPVGAQVFNLTINADRNGVDVLAHFAKGTSHQTRLVHLFHVAEVVGVRRDRTVKIAVTHISRPYPKAAILLGSRILGRTGADGKATVTLPASVTGPAVLTVKDNLKTEPMTLTFRTSAGTIRMPGKN